MAMRKYSPTSRGRDGFLDHALVIAGLSLLLAAAFRNELFSGSDLFFKTYRDIYPTIGWFPWSRIEIESWRSGFFPLWNSYNLFGCPLLANYQSACLSPLMAAMLVLPLEKAMVPFLIGRLVLAGWGTFLFSRRIGAGKAASFLSSAAFALTGYLVQYVADLNVAIDVLIPFLFIAVDALAKKGGTREFLLTILAIALIALGGQPGSAAFTLAFGFAYGMFFVKVSHSWRRGQIMRLAAAAVAAGLICLPQALPFLEFVSKAWNFHTAAIGAASVPAAGAITAAAPGFYGPLNQALSSVELVKLFPYIGSMVLVLALAAAARPRTRTDAFFASAMIASMGVIFALPPFSLIASLPGLDQLTYIKYTQPLIAFSAAILAGKTADGLRRRGSSLLLPAAAVVVAFLTILARVRFSDLAGAEKAPFMNGALLTALTLCACAAAIGLFPLRPSRKAGFSFRRLGAYRTWSLTAIVAIELVAASSVNHAFIFWNAAKRDFRPLREIALDHPLARVAADEEVFVSNMGAVAPVNDVGVAEALILRESADIFWAMTFLKGDELYAHFMKYHSLRMPFQIKWLTLRDMAGIRYQLTKRRQPENQTVDWILETGQLIAPGPLYSGKKRVEINGDLRDCLFAHPPSKWRLNARTLKTTSFNRQKKRMPVLVSGGVDPSIKDKPGDGVWFTLIGEGRDPTLGWCRYLDPRRPSDDSWKSADVYDLERDRMSFSTLPGKTGDNDWALWGDPRVGRDEPIMEDSFQNGIRVYENGAAWPRAYVAGRVSLVNGPHETLRRMVELGGARLYAAVSASDVTLVKPGKQDLAKARVVEYGHQRVVVDTDGEGPVLLVLSDAYYPGWAAKVEGKDARIIRANHAFRAVEVPDGKARVEFLYRPYSFRVGVWAGLAGLLSIGASFLARGRGNFS